MRILVVGGAGYVGSQSVRHLIRSGYEVWVYDNLTQGHRGAVPADRLIVGDLHETEKLKAVLKANGIEAVMH